MLFTALLVIPALVIIGLVAITYIEHVWNLHKYPKGPFPMPIIGNLMLLNKQPWFQFANLSKTYGDIFSLSFGMNRVVIVNTIEHLKEALVTRNLEFSGRPSDSIPLGIITKGFKGIALGDYTRQWMFTRKLAYKSMHLYGNGLQKIENIITDEVDKICLQLTKENGRPIPVHIYFGNIIVNVINQYCFNKRYNIDDPELQQTLKFMADVLAGSGPEEPLGVFPWLRFFPESENIKTMKEGIRLRDKHLKQELNEHRSTLDPNNIRDITDSLLLLISEDEQVCKENGYEKVNEEDLQMILNDLFIAGVETTLSTIRWFFLYLFHNPEYQQKLYEEIYSKVGIKRPATYKDSNLLPFVQAAILETLRVATISPLGAPHKTTAKTSVGGKSIPKNTTVFFNFYNIHHNEKDWKNPDEFKPERWLNVDGTLKSEMEFSFLPFSTGTRSCLGEKLARMELFLIVTRVLAKFEVMPDPFEPMPDLEGTIGLAYAPKHHFNAVFKAR